MFSKFRKKTTRWPTDCRMRGLHSLCFASGRTLACLTRQRHLCGPRVEAGVATRYEPSPLPAGLSACFSGSNLWFEPEIAPRNSHSCFTCSLCCIRSSLCVRVTHIKLSLTRYGLQVGESHARKKWPGAQAHMHLFWHPQGYR